MAVLGFGLGFRDVRQWYTRIALLERRICLVEQVDRRTLLTGFLIAPDLLLTATHGVPDLRRGQGGSLTARFDYAVSPDTGELHRGETYPAAADWLVAMSPVEDLDLAVVRLARPVGEMGLDGTDRQRGWVDLNDSNADPQPGSALAIFQHAQGGPLKVAMNTESVIGFDEALRRLRYRTDTAPGASGAPCFDIDWKFVAMHQRHGFDHGNHNLGVPFNLIREWLETVGIWSDVSRPPPGRIVDISGIGEPQRSAFGLEPELKRALQQVGESQRPELKERSVDIAVQGAKPKVSKRVINTVASFMNSAEGGSVLLGVADDRRIVGIEPDYAVVNPQRADWDSFALWLTNILRSELDVSAPFNFFGVTRYEEEGREIAAIHVQAATSPVFVSGEFYVRVGNQNSPLKAHDLLAYYSSRWPASGAPPTGKP